MKAYYQAFGTFRIEKEGKVVTTYFPEPNLSIAEIENVLKNKYFVEQIYWE